MESILTSIKKLLGIDEEYTEFDVDITTHINTVFVILTQLGVGPPEGFFIEDKTAIWDDYIPDNPFLCNIVKSYIHKKVQLLFDPPDRGAVMDALNRSIAELEWRINVIAETTGAYHSESDIPSTGGGTVSGTTDYTKLKNLPKINGETLIGDYAEKDPNVIEMSESEIETMWDDMFGDE